MNLYIDTLLGHFNNHLCLSGGYGDYYIDCNPIYGMLSIKEKNGFHHISYRSIISIDKTPTAEIITTKMGKINCYFKEEFITINNFFAILESEVTKYD